MFFLCVRAIDSLHTRPHVHTVESVFLCARAIDSLNTRPRVNIVESALKDRH